MVVKQCLACNLKVPETQLACSCGHVFKDMKFIDGKRFSAYRAKLYSRLENKDLLGSDLLEWSESDEDMTTEEFQPERTRTAKTHRKTKKCNHLRGGKKHPSGKQTKRLRQGRRTIDKKDPEIDRFSRSQSLEQLRRAVQEINKRLFTQNLMWCTLRS